MILVDHLGRRPPQLFQESDRTRASIQVTAEQVLPLFSEIEEHKATDSDDDNPRLFKH